MSQETSPAYQVVRSYKQLKAYAYVKGLKKRQRKPQSNRVDLGTIEVQEPILPDADRERMVEELKQKVRRDFKEWQRGVKVCFNFEEVKDMADGTCITHWAPFSGNDVNFMIEVEA